MTDNLPFWFNPSAPVPASAFGWNAVPFYDPDPIQEYFRANSMLCNDPYTDLFIHRFCESKGWAVRGNPSAWDAFLLSQDPAVINSSSESQLLQMFRESQF